MSDFLTPGADGTPVPGGTQVSRVGRPPDANNLNDPAKVLLAQGKAWPGLFILSAADKRQSPPRLSVWLTALTQVAQAWVLVGGRDANRIVITLEVDAVRKVLAPARDQAAATPTLEVVWERAVREVDGRTVPEDRPGHEGHCGVEGLDNGNKPQREFLRSKLAECATEVRVLTDDEVAGFGA